GRGRLRGPLEGDHRPHPVGTKVRLLTTSAVVTASPCAKEHPRRGPAPNSGRATRVHIKEDSMSLVRLLPAWFHAIADYAVAASLIVVAAAVGGSSGAVATGIVVGAVVALVSMMTKYPLGVVKVLPFTIHSAGDYLAAALLVGAPFALNFWSGDTG